MSVLKCKMCGGDLEITEKETVAKCRFCGTVQTLPKTDDERKTNLYGRADRFRRNNEFDKAAALFEQLASEDTSDPELYWAMVLCRFGVNYVEDPATKERIPTVNRMQLTSIFDDADYKSALEYADEEQRAIYEESARRINEIQKSIRLISDREKPFDVFICYKETDEYGKRTRDSVIATELYDNLIREGFKVFFARITLEDKLGTAYEPYIFAALNSAKVMVVVGTKQEYFNAPWVKNEWSRYLALVKASKGEKMLIPAYRDMDPYDLPEEFAHLQAQDMSKLGFMQDLTRGIKKIIDAGKPEARQPAFSIPYGGVAPSRSGPVSSGVGNEISAYLTRVQIFLENGEWDNADMYCEKILDLDPVNPQAYLNKLLSQARVRSVDELAESSVSLDSYKSFRTALKYADPETSERLVGINNAINDRLRKASEQRAAAERERAERRAREDRLRSEIERAETERNGVAQMLDGQYARKKSIEASVADVQRDMAQSKNLIRLAGWIIGIYVIFILAAIIISAVSAKGNSGSLIATTGGMSGIIVIGGVVQLVLLVKLLKKNGKSGWLALLSFITYGLFGLIYAIVVITSKKPKALQQRIETLNGEYASVMSQIEASSRALNSANARIEQLRSSQ